MATLASGAPVELIDRFLASFDAHDWDGLQNCLADSVIVDYRDLRGEPELVLSAVEYAEQRQKSLDHLDMVHRRGDLRVESEGEIGTLHLGCRYEIKRQEQGAMAQFNTWGTYRFTVVDGPHGWRISRIAQTVTRREGDATIHRGTPR
jgi:hypothetical protein